MVVVVSRQRFENHNRLALFNATDLLNDLNGLILVELNSLLQGRGSDTMDAFEATQIVFSRIQRMEPENVCEIMDYLLSRDSGDGEMIRLAFSPDALLHCLIAKAKANEEMYKFHLPAPSPSPFLPYWDPLQLERPLSLPNWYRRDNILVSTNSNNSHNMAPSEFIFPSLLNNGDRLWTDQLKSMASSVSDVNTTPLGKPCQYFARGCCKHGNNCRFLHDYSKQEYNNSNNNGGGRVSPSDEYLLNGSLERLEIELQELLRGKRAPISIASLPQLYYEKYGRTLQAEGYLTESQRHGKAGYSLTKLLARLKGTVTLIDRPHGQHAVVLAEDAERFMLYRGESDYFGGLNSSSRQIYMTFPAESAFTEKDVSNYFRTYGPVHDVRIPYQEKRMFGFVTFTYPETVKTILTKGNPHYVCGARVLVKPYREKTKIGGDRKYIDIVEQSKYMSPCNLDTMDNEQMHFGLRVFDNSGLVTIQMEQKQAIEFESRRLAEMHLINNEASIIAASTAALTSHTGQSPGKNGQAHYEEEFRAEDVRNFSPKSHFGYLLEVLESKEDGLTQPTHESDEDQESYGHILPESPFGNTTESKGNGTLHNSEETKSLIGESLVTIPKISGQAISPTFINKPLACSMCLGALVDPRKLECNHAFCSNCMPKLGEMSQIDECLICGHRLVKLPRKRVIQEFRGKSVVPASRVW